LTLLSILTLLFTLTPLVTIVCPLRYLPSIASSVAQELTERIDITLDGIRLPASESDTQGRVVVITDTGGGGTPASLVLLDAIRLRMEAEDGLIILDEDVVKVNDYLQTASDLFFRMMIMTMKMITMTAGPR